MNLLALTTWHPYPPDNGARIRAWNLLTRLAERHSVRVVAGRQPDAPTSVPPEVSGRFESFQAVDWAWHQGGRKGGKLGDLRALLSPTPRSIAETPNPALVEVIDAELSRRPDLMLVLQMGMDAYLPALPPNVPAVLEEAEITLWDQAAACGGVRSKLTRDKAYAYWKRRLARYQAVTVVSEAEATAVRALLGGNVPPVSVVPNGVDLDALTLNRKPEPATLLYNGSVTYGPNKDAVRWFVEEILPRVQKSVPEAKLVVTGKVPDDCRDLAQVPGVCLTGYLDSLDDVLSTATVCVVPLRAGGGTRLKILEAWASGVPVVSTSVGAAGLDGARDGIHLVLAEDAESFASQTVALLREPSRCQVISDAGRALAREQYGWDALVGRLETVLSEAVTR